ncbi:MAG: tryptophan 7-halogenase [Polyangiaceae bacterium]|nr:tryptophan 7-halogenase [Polyangiaceae bacterium]
MLPSRSPLETYDVIVVGGGPAGSTTAAAAARANLRVLLLEASAHPRTHVGESLLPGMIPILEDIGALGDVADAGFTEKTGSTHWGWGRLPEWDLWFRDSETYDRAWLVERSRFDEILFRAAGRAGAVTRENAAVRAFERCGDRVTGARYQLRGDARERRAEARFTVDASGQAFLLGRQLGLLCPIDGLKHRASWAHFSGAGRLPPPRESQALFAAGARRWIWFFPLSETVTSVGIVELDDEAHRDDAFDAIVASEPRLEGLLGASARRTTPVRHVRDWSYRASRVCGPGWVLAGDASGFIDPVLSTGVYLAMHAGYHAAKLIAAVVHGSTTEPAALEAYQAQHAALFTDLLRIVRFFYQQNLHLDDYFWESKKILLESKETELRPRHAFMILTSGLVRNLALDDKQTRVDRIRTAMTAGDTRDLDTHDPDRLGFVCFHTVVRTGTCDAPLYLLIEPVDPAAPALFRTANFHLNGLAPRLGNDPVRVPGVGEHLHAFARMVIALDTQPGESLPTFWHRARGSLVDGLRRRAPELELVRVFGE